MITSGCKLINMIDICHQVQDRIVRRADWRKKGKIQKYIYVSYHELGAKFKKKPNIRSKPWKSKRAGSKRKY